MKNRCETQFKIQKIHFQKLTYLLEKRKPTKGIEKKPSGHFNTNGFLVRKKLKNTKLEML